MPLFGVTHTTRILLSMQDYMAVLGHIPDLGLLRLNWYRTAVLHTLMLVVRDKWPSLQSGRPFLIIVIGGGYGSDVILQGFKTSNEYGTFLMHGYDDFLRQYRLFGGTWQRETSGTWVNV